MIYIGIDNGVSGSIGVVEHDGLGAYYHMPIKNELSYTKKKQWISRIDTAALKTLLGSIIQKGQTDLGGFQVALERPMVNPGKFKSTVSALRALEATLVVVEDLKLRYRYIDSKEWQRDLLPKGLKKEELKVASLQIGKRLFPFIAYDELKFRDADGILIAEYQRRQDLKPNES
jgi:hypothetical protein